MECIIGQPVEFIMIIKLKLNSTLACMSRFQSSYFDLISGATLVFNETTYSASEAGPLEVDVCVQISDLTGELQSNLIVTLSDLPGTLTGILQFQLKLQFRLVSSTFSCAFYCTLR